MSENSTNQIVLRNKTATFNPKIVDHAGAINTEDIAWKHPESKEVIWELIESYYTDLALVAENFFSVSMPEFDRKMFEMVAFTNKSGAAADHHPNSGYIRLATSNLNSELDLLKNMAHEIGHFAALRKIFANGADEIPARVGVSVIGNRVASPDGKTPFEFQQYRGDVINEALTEITAAEMVNQLKGKYDFIPPEGVQPESV